MDTPNRRNLFIALNARSDLPRDALSTLALQADRWLYPSKTNFVSLAKKLGIASRHLALACEIRAHADESADIERRAAFRLGATIICLCDDDYPGSLLDLPLPPPVLYCLGTLPARPGVSIVGSRNADPHGREIAELFARELSIAGLTIVSGFARGVDSAAHRGAVAADGHTVAVLGCGIDRDYPRGQRPLRDKLLHNGALLSEFPIGTTPLPRHFPVRNRIIAALSVGTLVVQATPRSGSLITARHALDLGRDVYAIPGPIFERRAAGPNTLIRDGALLVQHPRDILESLPQTVRDQLKPIPDTHPDSHPPPLSGPIGRLLKCLQPAIPVSAEQLSRETRRPVSEVLGDLLELELGGWVRRLPGSRFMRRL